VRCGGVTGFAPIARPGPPVGRLGSGRIGSLLASRDAVIDGLPRPFRVGDG